MKMFAITVTLTNNYNKQDFSFNQFSMLINKKFSLFIVMISVTFPSLLLFLYSSCNHCARHSRLRYHLPGPSQLRNGVFPLSQNFDFLLVNSSD